MTRLERKYGQRDKERQRKEKERSLEKLENRR